MLKVEPRGVVFQTADQVAMGALWGWSSPGGAVRAAAAAVVLPKLVRNLGDRIAAV